MLALEAARKERDALIEVPKRYEEIDALNKTYE